MSKYFGKYFGKYKYNNFMMEYLFIKQIKNKDKILYQYQYVIILRWT